MIKGDSLCWLTGWELQQWLSAFWTQWSVQKTEGFCSLCAEGLEDSWRASGLQSMLETEEAGDRRSWIPKAMKDSSSGGKNQVDGLDSQRWTWQPAWRQKGKSLFPSDLFVSGQPGGEWLTSVREGLPPSVELSRKCPAGNLHSGSLSWFQIDYIINTQCSFEQSIQSAGFKHSL